MSAIPATPGPTLRVGALCEVAAHLTDHVLPHVPARQWVLSVPKRLRPYLHHDVRVAGAVLQILLRAIRTTLRRTSPKAPPNAQLGAVSFFHRFGSSLNVHPHYHLDPPGAVRKGPGADSLPGAGDPTADPRRTHAQRHVT